MAFYDVTHGPPTPFDSTHAWAPSVAAAPPTLGDSHHEPRVLPQIVIDNVTGYYDSADVTDNRDAKTNGVGEVSYPPRVGGLTRIYECHIEADDRLELMLVKNNLIIGYAAGDDGVMTVTPWPAFGGPTPVVWTFSARMLDRKFSPAWQVSDGLYEWDFSLTFRLGDPNWYQDGTAYPP